MAEIPNKIVEIVKKYVREALIDNVRISQAVLFGSYAKGTNHEYSDIDIAVVSDDFEGNSFYDSRKLSHAMQRTSIDIETHPYRPEDFTTDNPFVREILEYGVRIV
jgi:predicted nucleotidyltransferase